ncbi:sugar isomerase [Sphingobium yanoikuyae]|jgi:sulfoquinovose isomerase|uniref:Sugar isomerase n=1 Tax=Sphingobium yanoikuyae TaxID=13690 RepID=A0A177K3Q4_SPHYA|nr:AGE family epimerase/isomerase [Sphingobium yanoikuyae]MDG2515693.1 AGE family epimerase/isomerase [Sphingobium yanoikuyae]OAH48062.1 sugar isomerase [Sphingobium yanoikuyae]RSU67661.1 sugar isomerase [Sphingomonas sp. S-NIH.Pt3_0716]
MVDMLATLSVPSDSWLRSPLHHQWLETQGQKLLDFSKESRVDAGFAPLDDRGFLSDDAHADTIVTARMTHAYALGAVQGLPGCAPLVEHGIAALLGPLRDERHGGWLPMEGDTGGRKLAYVHAFVGLAASSAIVAEAKGADTLMAHVLPVLEDRFWSDEEGAMRESFAADWSDEEDYRGANSNMHSTEMAMALADVLDAPVWRERALRIVTRIVHDLASQRNYRLLEHFDRNWAPILDYNADDICNDLRPYGQTPGHFLEWSHLLLKLEAALLRAGEVAPDWLLTDAIGLFDAGVTTGWARNGKPGILYTVDSKDEPSVSNRPHWVQAEAVTAAAALLKRTGRRSYETWYRRFWDFLDLHMIDRRCGSWHNEVDSDNYPSSCIYSGKPDLYHAYQSTLTPVLPLAPSLMTMLAMKSSRKTFNKCSM